MWSPWADVAVVRAWDIPRRTLLRWLSFRHAVGRCPASPLLLSPLVAPVEVGERWGQRVGRDTPAAIPSCPLPSMRPDQDVIVTVTATVSVSENVILPLGAAFLSSSLLPPTLTEDRFRISSTRCACGSIGEGPAEPLESSTCVTVYGILFLPRIPASLKLQVASESAQPLPSSTRLDVPPSTMTRRSMTATMTPLPPGRLQVPFSAWEGIQSPPVAHCGV